MTHIFCSKKLQKIVDNLDKELSSNSMVRSLNNWNCQLFFMDRKKHLIFVNNLTSYCLVLVNFKKNDFVNINNIFRKRLFEQLIVDDIPLDKKSFDQIFEPIDLHFFKTNNDRRIIGNMVDLIYQFKAYREDMMIHLDLVDISEINGYLNKIPYNKPTESKKILSFPRENMSEEIIKTNA